MAFSAFVIAMFLVSVSFIEHAECKCPELDEFGKKVKDNVPDKNLDMVFAVNYKNKTELDKAVQDGTDNIYKIVGVKTNKTIVDDVDADNKGFGNHSLTKKVVFYAFIYAITKGYPELGLLNDSNSDDLAKKFAEEINKAADKLEGGEEVGKSFMCMTTAAGNFYKSSGVKTEEDMEVISKYFLEGLEKCKEKDSGEG